MIPGDSDRGSLGSSTAFKMRFSKIMVTSIYERTFTIEVREYYDLYGNFKNCWMI